METTRLNSSTRSLLLIAVCVWSFTAVADVERPDLGRLFDGLEGTFVLLDGRTGRVTRVDPERAAERFLPASTFKIPNALIALETGVAGGPEFALAWDPERDLRQPWWPESWARDHTLATAMPHSAVWFFQELARRIGARRMREHLDRFDYGNREISGGIDRFWLDGGLRISADEQVRFLRRLHDGELGVSARSAAIVRELLVLEEGPGWRLSGKTGWARPEGSPQVGWLVGWVERGGDAWFFALNLTLRSSEDAARRRPIAEAILRELGILGGGTAGAAPAA